VPTSLHWQVSLSWHAITTLVFAMICTWVDFENAASCSIRKLQFVLYAVLRLIKGIPKFAHILDFIRDSLHSTAHTVQNQFIPLWSFDYSVHVPAMA